MYKYALGVALTCFIATPVLAEDWGAISNQLKDLGKDYKDLKADYKDLNKDKTQFPKCDKQGHDWQPDACQPNRGGYQSRPA